MKVVKFMGYCVLVIVLTGLIVLMNGKEQTAVSADAPGNMNGLPNITTSLIASGFNQPVDIVHSGDERLFVVEQAGIIRIVDTDGTVLPTPFLDITQLVEVGSETGLLGLAFDPFYDDTGLFYVSYSYCTDEPGCSNVGSQITDLYTRISQFQVSEDPYVADDTTELIIMEIQQPFGNHNGGDINFGPDGYLYIGLGDGGGGGDPQNNAQNMGSLLGKMLRIDIHNGPGNAPDCDPNGRYVIPTGSDHFGNPFADGPGGSCDEIWSLGLRNPWRFSFDRITGSMFIGDVGQDDWEEVDYQPANGGGENWGWRCYEGNFDRNLNGCEDRSQYDFPVAEYPHSENTTFLGCAIAGGYIYRGAAYPALQGYYIFGDWCTGNVWLTISDVQGEWSTNLVGMLPGVDSISTFGEDCAGELFVADHRDGQIYQIQSTGLMNTISGDELNEAQYLPAVFHPDATVTPLATSPTNPTPTFTPSPTSISPDQCVN